jgi:hypothetical protein
MARPATASTDSGNQLPFVEFIERFQTGQWAMRKVKDYKAHAEECRTMARHATDEDKKQGLLNMADTWEGLAENRASHIERQKRIGALDRPSPQSALRVDGSQ